jgi:chromosome segregation ATPase
MAEEGLLEFDDLPEFANDSNRDLHRQLRENEKAIIVVETELAETKERIVTMEEHLKSVNTEQLHTQRLVDAKIKEIETEDHLKQLAERERGRFQAEYKKLQTELGELYDKVNAAQSAVFKGNERMDQFKLQMNWNQEELEQWALAARQKEEDNLALLKYTKVRRTFARPHARHASTASLLPLPGSVASQVLRCVPPLSGGRGENERPFAATGEDARCRAAKALRA